MKPVILCVDDTPSVLEGEKMLLEENGYRVLTATNGKEAVQAFTSHSVDLVLLDYHMPEMNGGTFDALKAQGAGDRTDTHYAEPEPDKPNGISLKNDGIQKRL